MYVCFSFSCFQCFDTVGWVAGTFAVSCAETAEPIDLPFELWTRVGRRKHECNRIRQMAPTYLTTLCRGLCENGWTDRFAVSVADLGRLKEAQVQSYSPGGASVPTWEATLAPPGEYDWTVHLLRWCGLMSHYFDHLFQLLLMFAVQE